MKLKLLADEDVNYNIIKALRNERFEIISVLEDYRSSSDEDIIKISQKLKSILITEDKDFGEWVFAHRSKITGVIFLRYAPLELARITNSLIKVILKYDVSLYGKFVVITPQKIRIRDIV
ncbi:MAG: DUF5615 family PIN-like protein [Calditrichaeota bacterium]|nr:DUF5615 family PIN-like protein [Calditrichota bacterium]